jgi:hypothetical protein
LLERYRDWLVSGGTSPFVVNQLYIPMAGHVLGLNLKPHSQIDLEADLARAMEYVQAKQLSADGSVCAAVPWTSFAASCTRSAARQRSSSIRWTCLAIEPACPIGSSSNWSATNIFDNVTGDRLA